MHCPTLDELPTPDGSRKGWPWTEGSPQLAAAMPDGQPWPRITVITPSFNQAAFLEETIRSVLLQGYPELEYIIVDGGSSDASVNIIKRYTRLLTRWVSEPDAGQADAINKGLARANGEIFNWINSDDLLMPGALHAVARVFTPGVDALVGNALVFGEGKETVVHRARGVKAVKMVRGDSDVDMVQPAIWLRRELVERCGGPDVGLHFYFDMDLLTRYVALFPRVRYEPAVVAALRLHPATKTATHQGAFYQEYVSTLRKLSSLEGFSMLHAVCRRRLEELKLHGTVHGILAEGFTSRWRRAIRLLGLAARRPRPRMVRICAAALRRLGRGEEWLTPPLG
jgi:glycosyltransferase involved in cell wall biosynthesis